MNTVLLITKRDDWSNKAALVAKDAFGDITCIRGDALEAIPEDVGRYEGDILISFLCPWILPQAVLDRFKLAINFHPASSEYPGMGCYNFAIYEAALTYGAICHHMAARVDSGPIIDERRFPILASDTILSLKNRTMAVMLGMFAELTSKLAADQPLPVAHIEWKRKAFRLKDLDALRVVSPDMTPVEIKRRVRATEFPGYPGATVTLAGISFTHKSSDNGSR